jgi:hypothetical protein
MPLLIVKPKKKYLDFPCISCPFSKDVKREDSFKPLCDIYGGTNGAGLQACEELKAYCENHAFTFEKDVKYFFGWEIK